MNTFKAGFNNETNLSDIQKIFGPSMQIGRLYLSKVITEQFL